MSNNEKLFKKCNFAIVEVHQILLGIKMWMETLNICVKCNVKFATISEKSANNLKPVTDTQGTRTKNSH